MERDFLGLTIKQEPQECHDSAPSRDSAMQWSFPNKVSGSQFLSFKGSPEDKPKTGFESLATTGLVTITTTKSYDSVQKPYPGVMQKNMILDKPGGIRYTVTTYPAQKIDAQSVHRPEIRVHPVTTQKNQTVAVAPVHQPLISPAGRNLSGSSTAQNLGEVSKSGPVPAIPAIPAIPAGTSVVGTTDLRNGSKSPVASAQLTIFYNGSVCVYDDISPEKAQAIMLLAGNGPPSTSRVTPPAAPVQAPVLMSSVIDGLVINRSPSAPCIPSTISIASHSSSQSAGLSGSCTDITSVRSSGVLASPCNNKDPSKVVSMRGSFPENLDSSAVPQARKASLARFLERRRGRIISTSPYARNDSSDDVTTPGSKNFAVNSSSSSPVPATS